MLSATFPSHSFIRSKQQCEEEDDDVCWKQLQVVVVVEEFEEFFFLVQNLCVWKCSLVALHWDFMLCIHGIQGSVEHLHKGCCCYVWWGSVSS